MQVLGIRDLVIHKRHGFFALVALNFLGGKIDYMLVKQVKGVMIGVASTDEGVKMAAVTGKPLHGVQGESEE